jgi:hypothetical protein
MSALLQKVQQTQEIRNLERALRRKARDIQRTAEEETVHQITSLYPNEVSQLDALAPLVSCFEVTVDAVEQASWQQRRELLFGDEHYSEQHHRRAAHLLDDGFRDVCQQPRTLISFAEGGAFNLTPDDGTDKIMGPSGQKFFYKSLRTIKSTLQEQESELVSVIYELIRQPGQVPASGITADQAVPIPVILNLWENGDTNMLNTHYGSQLSAPRLEHLDSLVEQLDICICWRQHVQSMLTRLLSLGPSTHEMEKQAIVSGLYNMAQEQICYVRRPAGASTRARKVLALSRCNGFLVSRRQVDIANSLIRNPEMGMQAPLGVGKSSVIVPLLVDSFADGYHSVWVICLLSDKPETLQRAEAIRSILNHRVTVFHFRSDGTHGSHHHSDEDGDNESLDGSPPTASGNSSGSGSGNLGGGGNKNKNKNNTREQEQRDRLTSAFTPCDINNASSLRDLYCDMLRTTIERGMVITTRESLLYFVDMYEYTWMKRARAADNNDESTIREADELLDAMAPFFVFWRRHTRAVLDEIDEILKANIKVNIAVSDRAKINRNTLALAVRCVGIMLDPREQVDYQGNLIPIIEVIALLDNIQAATAPDLRQAVRMRLAQVLGEKEFGFTGGSFDIELFLAYVLCSDEFLANEFFARYLNPETAGKVETPAQLEIKQQLAVLQAETDVMPTLDITDVVVDEEDGPDSEPEPEPEPIDASEFYFGDDDEAQMLQAIQLSLAQQHRDEVMQRRQRWDLDRDARRAARRAARQQERLEQLRQQAVAQRQQRQQRIQKLQQQLRALESVHPRARDIVRLRELLGGSFATVFKRHNLSLGRMFTNENPDDVGPYCAANTPIKNSHLSSEYDWSWALAVNYAIQGVTESQVRRHVHALKTLMIESWERGDEQCEDAAQFEVRYGYSLLSVSDSDIPALTNKINDIGPWQHLAMQRVQRYCNHIKSTQQRNVLQELGIDGFLGMHNAQRICRLLLAQPDQHFLNWVINTPDLDFDVEERAYDAHNTGLAARLHFLSHHVNLDYFPYYIEGCASTLLHLFKSTCGFSGTMDAIHSLPQSLLNDRSLLRDARIDGVVLQRFVRYALGDSGLADDTTMFVDEAAASTVNERLASRLSAATATSAATTAATTTTTATATTASRPTLATRTSAMIHRPTILGSSSTGSQLGDAIERFVVSPDERAIVQVLLACRDSQAIVDGGALLDVVPERVIQVLVRNPPLVKALGAHGKAPIGMIRWKDTKGEWSTCEIGQALSTAQVQQQRVGFSLVGTLTFYDQRHSRGTDAKLIPDALMVNTVGDETTLADWMQAEGRARQSGKGQTSRTIVAPHTRSQHSGHGPLAIRILRTLLRRTADREVSETFYAVTEQLRGYVRDWFRTALTNVYPPIPPADRTALANVAQELFVMRCDADLASDADFVRVAKPFEYDSAERCLMHVRQEALTTLETLVRRIEALGVSDRVRVALCTELMHARDQIMAHRLPPNDALPAGLMGIPRPGEQSCGTVLSTEMAQQQTIETEVETEVETEILTARQVGDIDSLRPPWVDWGEWRTTLYGVWQQLEAADSLFVGLSVYYSNYQMTYVSKNLGFYAPANPNDALYSSTYDEDFLLRSSRLGNSSYRKDESQDEERFYWLHDAYIEPFVYHLVIQHPSEGFRAVVVSHQEYSAFVFPLLSNAGAALRATVFRHQGWGWVPMDSALATDNSPMNVDFDHAACRRCLAECALVSGRVNLGNTWDQLSFMSMFSPDLMDVMTISGSDTSCLRSMRIEHDLQRFNTIQRSLGHPGDGDDNLLSDALMRALHDAADCEPIRALLEKIAPSVTTIADLRLLMQDEKSRWLAVEQGKSFVKMLCAREMSADVQPLVLHLFPPGLSISLLIEAKQQLRVIAGRHRPGINARLYSSPMWRMISGLLRVLEGDM